MKELNILDEQPPDREQLQVGRISENTEAARMEMATARITAIPQLRPEVWTTLNESQREWGLREVGRNLSDAYECPAPPLIGSKLREDGHSITLGEYSDDEYRMRVNDKLLKLGDSGQALETYCHEFRHAYQHEMATRYNSAFRHLCHDETQAAKWAENLDGGYIPFEDNAKGYKNQSVERDARDFAHRIREGVESVRSV